MPADAAWWSRPATLRARSASARRCPCSRRWSLCPHATVIAPDMAKYKRVSEEIRTIFASATSIVEPVSLDEAYLDLTDDYRTEAPPAAEALAQIARRVEDEVGITVSIGLSCNKFLAKLASELEKPRGFSVDRPGRGEGVPGAAVGAQDPRRRRGHGAAHGGERPCHHRRPAGAERAAAGRPLRQVRPAARPASRTATTTATVTPWPPRQEHLRRDDLSPRTRARAPS